MKQKSASTLIYFSERVNKKNLPQKVKHIGKEKRRVRIKRALWAVLIMGIIGIGVWLYAKYRPFDIVRTEVEGAHRFVNMQDVKNIVDQQSLGENCLIFNTKALEQIIRETFLATKSVKAIRTLPNSVKVVITERVPIALIKNGDLYFVDSDGFVLGLAEGSTTNLPIINYSQKVEVGKFVERSAVSYYFDLIKALDEEGISVSTINSFPKYTVFLSDGIEVFFTNSQPAKSQAKIFAKMIEAFKAEGRKPKKIDLRFDKVVVEFAEGASDSKAGS